MYNLNTNYCAYFAGLQSKPQDNLKDLFKVFHLVQQRTKREQNYGIVLRSYTVFGGNKQRTNAHKGVQATYGGLPINEYVVMLKYQKKDVNHRFSPLKVGYIYVVIHTYLSPGVCLKVP